MEVFIDEVVISADEYLMSQVWINLIHNSIKFTPEGGKIQIDLLHLGSKIIFKIADLGIGIAEDDLPYIFERFYKADKSRTRSPGGSGLELSIVKKIFDMHRGIIGVQSKQDEGTIFTVTMPE